MPLSPEEQRTIETYNLTAEVWVSTHSSENFWGSEISTFNSLVPSGELLEIGSGGGRDAKLLSNLGYKYTGVDLSEGLLSEARKANPNQNFVHASVYDLPFPDNTFDSFWASAVLLHIPKDNLDTALENIYRVSKPEAVGFIAIKEGENENVEWDNRFFAYYDQDEFGGKLTDNNFEIVTTYKKQTGNTTWLIYFARVLK